MKNTEYVYMWPDAILFWAAFAAEKNTILIWNVTRKSIVYDLTVEVDRARAAPMPLKSEGLFTFEYLYV